MTQDPSAGASAPAAPVPPAPAGPTTSGAAVASLILGLIAPCSLGLTALPGLVLGLVALGRIRNSDGRLQGKGLAAAGIILSALGLLVGLILVGIFMLMVMTATHRHGHARWEVEFGRAPSVRVVPDARAHEAMDALLAAARRYAEAHGGRLPRADEYPAALRRWLPRGHAAPGGPIAMNAALSGMRLAEVENPGRTVLFFEVPEGRPLVGGRELVRGPIEGGLLVGFVDGHAERVPPEAIDGLVWTPRGTLVIRL